MTEGTGYERLAMKVVPDKGQPMLGSVKINNLII